VGFRAPGGREYLKFDHPNRETNLVVTSTFGYNGNGSITSLSYEVAGTLRVPQPREVPALAHRC
jgi:hypothetical protein